MKKIIALLATTAISASAFADDITVTPQGRFQFEGAGVKQSALLEEEKYVTTNRKKFGLDSNAFVGARITAERDDLKYGAQISLLTSVRQSGSPSYERTHLFVESRIGKVELGSNYDAGSKMSITALTVARASGDNASNYAMLSIKNSDGASVASQPMFPSSMYYQLDSKNKEGARKITYYTPKLGGNEYGGGIQFGVSYIPDSGNFGSSVMRDAATESHNKGTEYGGKFKNNVSSIMEKIAVKDGISYGASFEHHMSDMTSLKIAANGEYGKVAQESLVKAQSPNEIKYKVANLKTYNVGAILTHGNYSLVGSYTDMGKSLTSQTLLGDSRKTKYYSAGAVYNQGPVGISLSYYKAEMHKNKMDTYVLGTDYIVAPGLQPYAEIACFKGKGSLPDAYIDQTKKKFKGMVFLMGMRLSF